MHVGRRNTGNGVDCPPGFIIRRFSGCRVVSRYIVNDDHTSSWLLNTVVEVYMWAYILRIQTAVWCGLFPILIYLDHKMYVIYRLSARPAAVCQKLRIIENTRSLFKTMVTDGHGFKRSPCSFAVDAFSFFFSCNDLN